jgi:hypothetical protein
MTDEDWDRLTVFNHLDERFDYETKHNLPHDERAYAKEVAFIDTEEKISHLRAEHLKLQEGLKKQLKSIIDLEIALEVSVSDELSSLREQIGELDSEVLHLEYPRLSPDMTVDERREALKSIREKYKPLLKEKKDLLKEVDQARHLWQDILATEQKILHTTEVFTYHGYWMSHFQAAKNPLLADEQDKNIYIFADDFRPGGKFSEFPENKIVELDDLELEMEPDVSTVEQRLSVYPGLPPDNPASNIINSVNEIPSSPAIGAGLGRGWQNQVESRRNMPKGRMDMAVEAPKLLQGLLSERQKDILTWAIGATIGFGVIGTLAKIWQKFKYRTRRWGNSAKNRSKNEWKDGNARRHAREWVRVKNN